MDINVFPCRQTVVDSCGFSSFLFAFHIGFADHSRKFGFRGRLLDFRGLAFQWFVTVGGGFEGSICECANPHGISLMC